MLILGLNGLGWLATVFLAVIISIVVLYAHFACQIRAKSCILLALTLFCAPIVQVMSSSQSYVYSFDVIGLLLLAYSIKAGVKLDKYFLLICALFTLPFVSTAVSLFELYDLDFKLLGIALLRYTVYLGYFLYFRNLASGDRDNDFYKSIPAIRLFAVLFSLAGVGQLIFGYSLSSWIENDWGIGSIGTGYLWLYRGEVGAFLGLMSILAYPLIAHKKFLPALLYFAILAAGVLVTGSRQGLLAIGVSLIWSSIQSRHFSILAGGAVLASLYIVFLTSLSVNNGAVAWLSERYTLEAIGVRGDVIKQRDERIPIAIEKGIDNPRILLVGMGYVEVCYGYSCPQMDRKLLYVDSEIAWRFQEIGIVGVLMYSLLLAMLFLRARNLSLGPDRGVYSVSLVVGLSLCAGHYYLLHPHNSQAFVSVLQWLLIGLLLGTSEQKCKDD